MTNSTHRETGAAVTSLPQFELAPGYQIPRIIRGGWQLATGHGHTPVERETIYADMDAYAAAGLTVIDCSNSYTGVEQLIGDWRRARPDNAKGVRVHTKFVPPADSLEQVDAAEVERVVDQSRTRLGMPVLDFLQFHWWKMQTPGWVEAAQTLVELQRRGWIRLLGGTNFDTPALKTLAQAGVHLTTMQVQYSLLDDRPSRTMQPWAATQGMHFVCYGTLAGGFMGERWRGVADPGLALENKSLVKYKLIIDAAGGWDFFQALLDVMAEIAAKHGVDIAAVAVQYVLNQPGVAAAIVGVRHRGHLPQQLAAARLALDEADLAALAKVLTQRRALEGDCYELERSWPPGPPPVPPTAA
jgi:aryl-alcohol dehydrogenase-like predicted oxidoreductase